jgi:hypothetical protein
LSCPSAGAQKCGIEKTKAKMVGRGVLLDVARKTGHCPHYEVMDWSFGIILVILGATLATMIVPLGIVALEAIRERRHSAI